MTGGINWPPQDETASIAPATWARYPACFMRGIVTTPVETTLPTVLPEIVPNSEDATIEILAGPPRNFPIRTEAISVKKVDPPERKSV